MRKMLPYVFAAALGVGVMVGVNAMADDAAPTATLDAAPVVLDAAPAPDAAPRPSDSIDNAAEHPLDAVDDVVQAKKKSWPLAMLVVLIVLSRSLGAAARKWDIKAIDWVDGKVGKYVVIIGTCGSAAFDVLALGGTWLVAGHAAVGALLYALVPEKAPDKSKAPAS